MERIDGRAGSRAPGTGAAKRQENYHRITDILRCKWTIAILDAIDRGVNRPGRMERELPGLTAKVLNERIRKLERYGFVERVSYPEVPPRVEYRFTRDGKRLVKLVRTVRTFVDAWGEARADHPGEPPAARRVRP